MTAARRLSEAELGLEYFYSRTYGAQYVLRIGTIAVVALTCLRFGLLTPATAALWVAAFLGCEVIIWSWWRSVGPQLGQMSDAVARRRQRQMTFFCGLSTSTAAAPFLTTADPTTAGAVVSVLFSAGVIMLVAAQQSMTRSMFLWTVPLPALALIRNMMLLADGPNAYVMAGLGLCFVVNARRLQLSNAVGEARLVRGMVEAERANDAKRDFLATVSHEIRTPLNGVIGMAQAMATEDLSLPQAERLQVVQRSAVALQALLNDVLDLSKIEAGKLELEAYEFDLAEQVRSAAESFLAAAREKGLDLRIDVAEAEGRVVGDAHRIRQILANLVSNAVKFTPAGSVTVRARWSDGAAQIDVEDTGIGLSAEAATRIFHRFAQADAATGRQFGGTGLGLAICRELAALMGGDVSVRSEPGHGCCFSLSVPLPRVTAPAEAALPESAKTFRLDGLRVLVAEDNLTNQLVLRHLLMALGDVAIEVAENGVTALHAYESGVWDLVLMDVNMPEMDGVGATLEIRRREAASGRRRTPILALTANAMAHQTPAYYAAGMDGVVAKPILASDLLKAMLEVLSAEGLGERHDTALGADAPLVATA